MKETLGRLISFFNGCTPREKKMMLLLAVCVAIFVDYFVLIAPVQRIFADTLPKLGLVKRELRQLKDDKKNKALIEEEWKKAKAGLEEAEERFVDADEISLLLENLSQLAVASGVKITSLKPIEMARIEKTSIYSIVPLKMNGLAGSHELGKFLVKLETSRIFYKVKSLRISENASDDRKHLIELEVESFRKG